MLDSPDAPIVLGQPWLVKHNPHIDWANNIILGWSQFCLSNCRTDENALTPLSTVPPATEDSLDLSDVLPEYLDLKAVLSKCSVFLHMEEGCLPASLHSGINNITVNNRYPLPLMSSAFELLQGAMIFTKLDLCSAYHLVQVREGDELHLTPSQAVRRLRIVRRRGQGHQYLVDWWTGRVTAQRRGAGSLHGTLLTSHHYQGLSPSAPCTFQPMSFFGQFPALVLFPPFSLFTCLSHFVSISLSI